MRKAQGRWGEWRALASSDCRTREEGHFIHPSAETILPGCPVTTGLMSPESEWKPVLGPWAGIWMEQRKIAGWGSGMLGVI